MEPILEKIEYFEFDGESYEFNPLAVSSYQVTKKLVCSQKDPTLVFEVAEAVFGEHIDEYYTEFGGDLESLARALGTLWEQKAKN